MKNPTEVVIGTLRLVGNTERPSPETMDWAIDITNMGQDLLNPPSVEGWHTGKEWIDSGTLVERINFTADQVGNTDLPGVKNIIERFNSEGSTISHEQFISGCLEMLGAYELTPETHSQLMEMAQSEGEVKTRTPEFETRVGQMLQSIVATTEYLFA